MDKITIVKKAAIISSIDCVCFYLCLIYLESLSLPPEKHSYHEDLLIISMLIPTIINSMFFPFVLRNIGKKTLLKIILLGIIFWAILAGIYTFFTKGWIVLPPYTLFVPIFLRLPTYIPMVVLFWILKKIRRITR